MPGNRAVNGLSLWRANRILRSPNIECTTELEFVCRGTRYVFIRSEWRVTGEIQCLIYFLSDDLLITPDFKLGRFFFLIKGANGENNIFVTGCRT